MKRKSTKVLAVLAAALALVTLATCSDGGSDTAAVTEGMTPAEVADVLGEPTATVELQDPATGVPNGFKATYDGEGGSWVSFEDDRVTSYVIGGYTGSP
jgi:hypothetical protein